MKMSYKKFGTTTQTIAMTSSKTKLEGRFEHPELLPRFHTIKYEVLIKDFQNRLAILSKEILDSYIKVILGT